MEAASILPKRGCGVRGFVGQKIFQQPGWDIGHRNKLLKISMLRRIYRAIVKRLGS
jgi:hypothetical protein